MKRLLPIFGLILLTIGCGSSPHYGNTSTPTLVGNWTIVISQIGTPDVIDSATLVASPCSIDSPDAGVFTVSGPMCVLADNESGQGNITSTDSTFTPQGVLLGTSFVGSQPSVEFLAVESVTVSQGAVAIFVFTGTGILENNQITGSWSCYPGSCQGPSGTFVAYRP